MIKKKSTKNNSKSEKNTATLTAVAKKIIQTQNNFVSITANLEEMDKFL